MEAARICCITGTDTGVGKTLVTVLLTRYLLAQRLRVRAVKPFCSGGRADALALRRAQANRLTLDEVNPWHFHEPLSPWLAARRSGRRVRLAMTVRFLEESASQADLLLVEGAGGILSPLGEDFSALDLITSLDAACLIVSPNRLGALNQALLAWNALPPRSAAKAHLLLVDPRRASVVTRTNLTFLRERLGANRVSAFPWLGSRPDPAGLPIDRRLKRALRIGSKRWLAPR